MFPDGESDEGPLHSDRGTACHAGGDGGKRGTGRNTGVEISYTLINLFAEFSL